MSGFVRVATHPRVFTPPAPVERALEFADALFAQPSAVLVAPGQRHWEIYERLCISAGAKGNLVSDAFIAALSRERWEPQEAGESPASALPAGFPAQVAAQDHDDPTAPLRVVESR